MPSETKLKVLYLAGSGRSGSTLIDVILGQVPGFSAIGESRDLWEYGIRDNRPCGCGEPVRGCPIWQAVLEEMQLTEPFDGEQMSAWRERFARTKRLVPMLLRGKKYVEGEDISTYLRVVESMFHAVARVTGSRVIVDGSKWQTYGFLLSNIESIDLYVLHLVRDPRACAFSWQRKKEIDPGNYLAIQSPLFTTSFWAVWNPAIRAMFKNNAKRYMFMRYEDFVKAPRDKFGEILRFIGADQGTTPFVNEDSVSVGPTHSIEGNIARFQSGEIQIKADSEWQEKISWGSKALVTAMTWPMLLR